MGVLGAVLFWLPCVRPSDLRGVMCEGAGPARARRALSCPAGHSDSGSRHLPSPGATGGGGLGTPLSLAPSFSPPRRPSRAPRSRDLLAGAGPRGAPRALTATSSRPGSRGSLPGESLEAEARRRAWNSRAAARSAGEVRRPRPRRGPSPRPPRPAPQRPSAPPEGGSAINKRVSVARGPRSCGTSRQISGSGRRVSRRRQTPAGAGERAQARPPQPCAPRRRSRSMAPRPPPPMPPSSSEGPRGSRRGNSAKD